MLIQNNYKPKMVEKKVNYNASEKRIFTVLILLVMSFITLTAYAINFQLNHSQFWKEKSDNVFIRTVKIPTTRGKIKDRNNIILALTEPKSDILIDPYKIPDFEKQKYKFKNDEKMLSQILIDEKKYNDKVSELLDVIKLDKNKKKEDLYKLFNASTYNNKKMGDVYLLRGVDKVEGDKIAELNLKSLKVISTGKRRYPSDNSFSSIIGISKIDIDKNTKNETIIGLEGIESAFNKELSGEIGYKVITIDNNGNHMVQLDSPRNKNAIQGNDVILSLDSRIQDIVASELKKTVIFHKAKSGSAVVLDAKTGEILSMANYPDFNPYKFNKSPVEHRKNKAVTDLIEPGSIMKPFIVAKSIDDGIVNKNTALKTMPYNIGRKTIRDTHVYPELTVTGILQKSSNVGVSKLSSYYKPEDLYKYYSSIGVGEKMNSGLPGEATKKLRAHETWKPIEQATMSYGYGLQFSLLQVARAYTLFTNDGALLPVTILKQNEKPEGIQLIKESTARSVREMLQTVTEKGGTGTRAAVNGYHVAAKTGTARKLVNGRYNDREYQASLVGFGPVNNPKIIVALTIDTPKENGYYGGTVAGPLFSNIMKKSLSLLRVPLEKFDDEKV